MPESTRQPVRFPDGCDAYLTPTWPGPAVQVRFGDGVMVEFRPATDWPHIARVKFAGVEVRGLRLDVEADLDPGGDWHSFSTWKTGVAGVDGGADVPVKVRDAALALCRRRAREARDVISVVSGRRGRLSGVGESLAEQPAVQGGPVV
jgi:hypothetical protein